MEPYTSAIGGQGGFKGIAMRLVVWNCNMALPRKWDALMALRPNIAVISECANPEVLAEKVYRRHLKPVSGWGNHNIRDWAYLRSMDTVCAGPNLSLLIFGFVCRLL